MDGEIIETERKEGIPDSDESRGMNYQDWNGIDEIVSMCMRCGENGTTRMMLHRIPFFRELIIASFQCDECGERNNEVTFGGEIQLHGCAYDLNVLTTRDLDRQLIKSDSASVKIPALDFEIPPGTQKGEINTIEGFLLNAAKNLSVYQEERMAQMPEVGAKVAEIIANLTFMAQGRILPFHIIVDDPAGNSFVENPLAPQPDPNMTMSQYQRSPEQDIALGLQPQSGGAFRDEKDTNFLALASGDFGAVKGSEASTVVTEPNNVDGDNGGFVGQLGGSEGGGVKLGRSEAVSIPSPCPNCQRMGESMTALTDIPHFKEVIIMAFTCNFCGFRNNEVKGGGAVPTFGTEVTLTVTGPEDLKRDVLKSDSCAVRIPELELELGTGTLGGVYTTVEGLIQKIHNSLRDSNPFAIGDSATLHHSAEPSISQTKQRFHSFLAQLQALQRGETLPFSLILRDPLGNSFVSAPLGSFLPPEADKNLSMVDFQRTFDENEEYGLNDINTKDYETGYEQEELEGRIRLPDRLTHVIPKGPDHPHLFAKGTEDACPGGKFFPATQRAVSSVDSSAAVVSGVASEADASNDDTGLWYQAPAGWSVARSSAVSLTDSSTAALPRGVPNNYTETIPEGDEGEEEEEEEGDREMPPEYGKRIFDPADFNLKFSPREEYGGRREGFVFRLGAQGLGYYEDKRPVIPNDVNDEGQGETQDS